MVSETAFAFGAGLISGLFSGMLVMLWAGVYRSERSTKQRRAKDRAEYERDLWHYQVHQQKQMEKPRRPLHMSW